MGKKSAPQAPDPMKTYEAQSGANIGTAVANQIMGHTNQYTPYGSLSYTQDKSVNFTDPLTGKTYAIPQYTATQTLSKGQQGLLNAQTAAGTNLSNLAATQSQRLGGILGKPVNLGDAPGIDNAQLHGVGNGPELRRHISDSGDITKSYGTDYAKNVQHVEDALMARLNPQLERDQGRLETSLANRGIHLGSRAYDRAQGDFAQQSNDARLGAILSAGQEQNRLASLAQNQAQFQNAAQQQQYNQNMGRANFYNQGAQQDFQNRLAGTGFRNDVQQQQFNNSLTGRNQYLNEQYANRNQPINEISALLGTGGVQNPSFVNAPGGGIANTDYAGLVQNNYANQLQNWQQKNAMNQSMLGGLFGLGAAGIGAF